MKKFYLIMFLFLFLPFNVSASPCSSSQINDYNKLAQQIVTTYDYTEQNGEVNFIITFHNVYKDLYIIEEKDGLKAYNNENGEITIIGYTPGNTYEFRVFNNNTICNGQVIKTIKVKLPYYNKYYLDPLCNNVTGNSLCDKWSNVSNISYEKFTKEMENYRKNKEKQDDEQVIEKNAFNSTREFLAKYYIYILILLVLVAILIIVLKNKNKKSYKF